MSIKKANKVSIFFFVSATNLLHALSLALSCSLPLSLSLVVSQSCKQCQKGFFFKDIFLKFEGVNCIVY